MMTEEIAQQLKIYVAKNRYIFNKVLYHLVFNIKWLYDHYLEKLLTLAIVFISLFRYLLYMLRLLSFIYVYVKNN